MSVAVEMGCERPSCWAAPSSVDTMLARSQARGSPDVNPEGPAPDPVPDPAPDPVSG